MTEYTGNVSLASLGRFKNLVLAPHADDEVLGCASVLGPDTLVYYCGIDESKVESKDAHHRIPLNNRLEEVKRVASFFGFSWLANLSSRVNNYTEQQLIGEFEKVINLIKPDKVFVPFPSYNQDHRAVFEAAGIALRPHDKNFFVKKVLVYEQDHVVLWEDKPLQVNYFVSFDVKRKIEGYKLHASQVRAMRSFDFIESLAKIRGKQGNVDFAEAFRVERWVD